MKKVVFLGAVFTGLLIAEDSFAQTCGATGENEEYGWITKVEVQPVSGTICGYPEFTDPEVEVSCPPKLFRKKITTVFGTASRQHPETPVRYLAVDYDYTSFSRNSLVLSVESTQVEECRVDPNTGMCNSGICVSFEEQQSFDVEKFSYQRWDYARYSGRETPFYITTSYLDEDYSVSTDGCGGASLGDRYYGIKFDNGGDGWYTSTPPPTISDSPPYSVSSDPGIVDGYDWVGDWIYAVETVNQFHPDKAYSTTVTTPNAVTTTYVLANYFYQSAHIVFTTILSEEVGASTVAEKIAQLGEEDWVPGWSAFAFLNWSGASFSGQAVRYRVRFACLPDDAELEFTYRLWPSGGNEELDGWEETETKSVGSLDVEETEDGEKEVKGFIEMKECSSNKRLIKVVKKTPCGGGEGGGGFGSGNGGGLSSINWWVSLGKTPGGKRVGNLRIEEKSTGSQIATPNRLKFDGALSPLVEIVEDEEGSVRQVKVPEGLADVVLLDDYSYEIRFYENGDFSRPLGASLYTAAGLPVSVWKVENPDESSADNRLLITHTEGEGDEVYLFEQGSGGLWTLETGDGLRKEELTVTTLGNGDRQEVRVVKNSSGVANGKKRSVFRSFPWGERMIEEELDPDGASLTTTWVYYDNATNDGAAYGFLKRVENANGSWERYEYDSEGRRNKVVSTWLDGAANADEGASRVVSTSWSGTAPQVATIVETAAGQEVGRRYWVRNPGGSQTQSIVSTEAGAGSGASSNLVTTTDYVTSGEFKGKVSAISHPDGTATTFTYSHTNGQITEVESHGAVSGGTVVAGRQTITIEDEMGNLESRETKDVASGLTLEHMTVTDRDAFGRPTRVDYSDGTYEEKTYSCCGVESERDRDGIVTTYTYDDLKRVVSESRGGLTTLYTYDASGRVLTRTRKGSDNSTIVVETNTYDLAGRQTSSTNALSDATTFGEAIDGSGRTVRTTTFPDGGTRVETTHKDGRVYTVAGTGAHPLKYEYGTHANGEFTKEIRVGEGGSETEWIQTERDLAGRSTLIEGAGGAETVLTYNTLGQLSKEVDPDGVVTLYTYNAEGEREQTVIDMDRNDAIGSADRVSITETSVLTAHGETVQRQEMRVVNPSGAEVVASRVDTTPNGRKSWQEQWGLLTTSVATVGSGGVRSDLITQPDGSEIERTSVYGRVTEETVTASGAAVVRATTNSYDAHGRLESSTDARNGTTAFTFNALDQITSMTTPSPGGGGGAQTTASSYDEMGRKIGETLPDSSTVAHEYFLTGELKETSGSQTYTTEYTYDPQGRMKTLTTTGQAGPATTTWTYNAATGRMTAKTYADGKGTTYTYSDAGRLATRGWHRGLTTTYSYDNGGELTGVDYSDGTPDVTYTRNRLGHITGITDGSGSRTQTVSDDGRLLTETYTSGMFNGVETTIGYDSVKRRDSFSLQAGSTTIPVSYGYDGASRLNSVTSGSDATSYSYLSNSSLIGSVTQAYGGSPVLAATKTYDNLNRLTAISTSAGGNVVSSHGYTYNALNQRTEVQVQDGTKWNYGYDSLGQVTSGGRKWADNSDVAGQQYGYAYDGIGNRTAATVNGRTASYTANVVNQYTEREVPGAIDIIGSATSTATVTVNNQATTRKDDYFYKALNINNVNAPQYLDVNVVAVLNNTGTNGEDLVSQQTGKVYLPKTPEAFAYDDDGNLLSDGRWNYTWDGENRLIGLESVGSSPEAAKKKLEFAYDGQSRRVQKKVYGWNGSSYVLSDETRFLYDGWNVVAELDDSNVVQKSFIWGIDLSGGLQGAGGIGGLQVMRSGGQSHLPCYDGNGNVMALVKAGDQSVAARYTYGPFGESIQTFEDGVENPWRFSTKFHDGETGFAYYGYRYYNPETGRWVNRDPIEEEGGKNLYSFVENYSIGTIDPFGLSGALLMYCECAAWLPAADGPILLGEGLFFSGLIVFALWDSVEYAVVISEGPIVDPVHVPWEKLTGAGKYGLCSRFSKAAVRALARRGIPYKRVIYQSNFPNTHGLIADTAGQGRHVAVAGHHEGVQVYQFVHDNFYHGVNALLRPVWERQYVVFDRNIGNFVATLRGAVRGCYAL